MVSHITLTSDVKFWGVCQLPLMIKAGNKHCWANGRPCRCCPLVDNISVWPNQTTAYTMMLWHHIPNLVLLFWPCLFVKKTFVATNRRVWITTNVSALGSKLLLCQLHCDVCLGKWYWYILLFSLKSGITFITLLYNPYLCKIVPRSYHVVSSWILISCTIPCTPVH